MNRTSSWILSAGRARRLNVGAGELSVLEGRVWVTGAGQGEDLVLSPGDCVKLADAREVVVEPWDRGQGAVLAWRPRGRGWGRLPGWRALVEGLAGLGARKAAGSAGRAPGCL